MSFSEFSMRYTPFYMILGWFHLIPTAVKATEVFIKQRYWFIHNDIIPLPKSWHDLRPRDQRAARAAHSQVHAANILLPGTDA